MKSITEQLLSIISDWKGIPDKSAYNIREDSGCAGRQSTANIEIISKTDRPGIDIRVKAGTKGETVYIPACITHSNVDDLVYNDFYIGEDADVTVVAGCGVHVEGEEESKHNGVHRFYLEKNSRVVYLEKHVGTGEGNGNRAINPVTWATLGEGSYMEMDTSQLGGVDTTVRDTKATLLKDAKLVVKEKLMTDGSDTAESKFEVTLAGDGSGVQLTSRSVAKGKSEQTFRSRIIGNAVCTGHSECDAIIMDEGVVHAIPELTARSVDAALIHEAAIGKIAGEQLTKLMTLGLSEKEAEQKIIEGFLK
ncbi:SufD family Fe-S cluster assembly protein [Pygmaiobacter massiliensis]|uniref:SufB/SufD family protein n=1 Tax=Pygmaiobacter massiliensis TaxID=1917873 RepID=UPI002A7FDEF3|nr:SufD family Fe-S cluster assembly protein [Pygmaiobacter massiliensis]MDY4785409.1 SufD family Fe-S cluster assembly protein [Pygmaiobacter massiliensis]